MYRYLTGKIQEGEAHNITCPGYSCSKLVPMDIIETLVSRDIGHRYLQLDIKVSASSLDDVEGEGLEGFKTPEWEES